MSSDFKIVEEPKKPLSMHPKKFAMWLFLVTVGMLFAAFTSAYIVRQNAGNWVYFELPSLFYYTTGLILASSVSMQLAYAEGKKDHISRVKVWITITFVLGVLFLIGQFMGYVQLVGMGIHLAGNPAESFVYLLTGVHGLHLIGAIVFLLIMLGAAFRNEVNSRNMVYMEMCTTFWHFLSGLWLYLFGFLLLYR